MANVLAQSISVRAGKSRWRENGDEEIDDEEEKRVAGFRGASIPSRMKATLKFGYDETLAEELGGSRGFDRWVSEVMTHTQAHYRHSESLGTQIEFEVCKQMKIFQHPFHNSKILVRRR